MTLERLAFASFVLVSSAGVSFAQLPPTNVAPGHADPYANDPYITGTGATVANPGASQSGGTTPLDRGVQRQDNKIDRSICKGC